MPMMRSMWLHHPDDPAAVARGDQFFWGRDLLVAPVVEKGATASKVYLPKGTWYDFWTAERIEGGREIERAVTLETTPLYVRAGAVIPMGPVKQYVDEKVDGPLTLTVYPGLTARHRSMRTMARASTTGKASSCASRRRGATPVVV
jgi:alpha-glucosidase/alpha-D-xyloside xylohydrolase